MGMLDLSNPDLDRVKLANGMGVGSARDHAESAGYCSRAE